MFFHGYNGYLKYAGNYDELKPLSCSGVNTWSSSSLTLIDALDTLVVLGNYSEFRRVTEYIVANMDFDRDINVSVFETNIRIVGGLLSAHLLSHKAGVELEPGFPCNGPLLRMAEKVARKLLPAFDTKTGMPYGTGEIKNISIKLSLNFKIISVNLKHGVPQDETSVTCTAGIGTFVIEFGTLSRLTGDPVYEEVAINALHSLFNHRSAIGLLGNHIDVQTGVWTAQDAGIGAGVDSYYEYLVKGAILLNRPELMQMFNEMKLAIDKYLNKDDWQIWASMSKGQITLPVFQSLQAFYPGMLSLMGDVNTAMRALHNMHMVWKQYGFLPEMFNIPNGEASTNRESYPLRPELIESVMYLYRATGDPYLLEVGEDILTSIEYSAKTSCGYASIKNVKDHRKQDTMESFFLAETTKYLFLLFDPDNFLNSDGSYGTVIDTKNGECIIESSYIFNTEAHPIDLGALRCCYDMPRESLVKGFNRKKFLGDAVERAFEGDSIDKEEEIFGEKPDGEFKQQLLEEIMSALHNAKKKIDENPTLSKRFAEMTNPDKPVIEEIKIQEKEEEKLEIIKLPSSALDQDDSTNQSKLADEGKQINQNEEESVQNQSSKKSDAKIIKKSIEKNNNSILTDFVKNILKTATSKPKTFDAQSLLEKINKSSFPRNDTWLTRYDLLTCKAQPYINRISVMGEFY
jgi:mannosidase alpha-like ER degradation enhancer 2